MHPEKYQYQNPQVYNFVLLCGLGAWIAEYVSLSDGNLWEMYYLQVPQLAVVNKISLCYVLQAGLVLYIAGK